MDVLQVFLLKLQQVVEVEFQEMVLEVQEDLVEAEVVESLPVLAHLIQEAQEIHLPLVLHKEKMEAVDMMELYLIPMVVVEVEQRQLVYKRVVEQAVMPELEQQLVYHFLQQLILEEEVVLQITQQAQAVLVDLEVRVVLVELEAQEDIRELV